MGWFYNCMIIIFMIHNWNSAEAGVIGVNYGLLGNYLPPPTQVISLLKSLKITKTRLFAPDHDVFQALEGSGIELIIGTLNQDLQNLGSDISFAQKWVNENIISYSEKINFRCISAGNEVIPSDLAPFVLPAMKNLKIALNSANLGQILVSTVVSTQVLGTSFPPSKSAFSDNVASIMTSIITFLVENKSPLLLNVYPYFAYSGNPQDISLSYALFDSSEVVVTDGDFRYKNLFDAMVDSVYYALEKAGGATIDIIVTETGWPSDQNGDMATISNAKTYNNKLIEHVTGSFGTPKKPGKSIEAYLFAIFNENLKPEGTEQHFGLYYPNMTQVYNVVFN